MCATHPLSDLYQRSPALAITALLFTAHFTHLVVNCVFHYKLLLKDRSERFSLYRHVNLDSLGVGLRPDEGRVYQSYLKKWGKLKNVKRLLYLQIIDGEDDPLVMIFGNIW